MTEGFDISWGGDDDYHRCPGCGVQVVFGDDTVVVPQYDEVWHAACKGDTPHD